MLKKPQVSTTSSQSFSVPIPRVVRLCRWLWTLPLGAIGTAALSHIIATLWDLGRDPKKAIAPNAPLMWLIKRWPITLPITLILLLLVLVTWVISQQYIPDATSPLAAQLNRKRMLGWLHHTYKDLVEQSLLGADWMELGFASQHDAVQNTSTLLLSRLHQTEQLLPAGTSITQVYEDEDLANHELLILGEPGAGKSTLLRQLGQYLVMQAKQDDRQPLPVILPLSSWPGAPQRLQDWAAKQIARYYPLSEQLASRWIQEDQILLLLDGLDEVEDNARSACIDAINTYRREHCGPMVVCSRKTEYEVAAQHSRLALQTAVVVQPLS